MIIFLLLKLNFIFFSLRLVQKQDQNNKKCFIIIIEHFLSPFHLGVCYVINGIYIFFQLFNLIHKCVCLNKYLKFNNATLFFYFFFKNASYMSLQSTLEKYYFLYIQSAFKMLKVILAYFTSFKQSWKYRKVSFGYQAQSSITNNPFIILKICLDSQ